MNQGKKSHTDDYTKLTCPPSWGSARAVAGWCVSFRCHKEHEIVGKMIPCPSLFHLQRFFPLRIFRNLPVHFYPTRSSTGQSRRERIIGAPAADGLREGRVRARRRGAKQVGASRPWVLLLPSAPGGVRSSILPRFGGACWRSLVQQRTIRFRGIIFFFRFSGFLGPLPEPAEQDRRGSC